MKITKLVKSSLYINLFTVCVIILNSFNATAQKSIDHSKSSNFDTVAVKMAVTSMEKMLSASFSRGDNEAVANCYTSDAEFMAPNFPAIVGRKNIASLYLAAKNAGEGSLVFSPITIWGNAQMVEEEGSYILGSTTGKQLDKGKYITLWRKEDGVWKTYRFCFNSDVPAAANK